jgi:type II secretory pathway pseudopilin PulG
VELLLVIGASTLLLAVLLPGLQKMREAAARVRCQHNLKQIGLAAHGYQAMHSRLPPGYLGPLANQASGAGQPDGFAPQWGGLFDGQCVGVLVYLLPYVEQDNLYKQILAQGVNLSVNQFGYGGPGDNWWKDGGAFGLASSPVKTFLCPAAVAYGPNAVLDGTFVCQQFQMQSFYPYTVAAGYLAAPFAPNSGYPGPGLTNYLGVCGSRGRQSVNGRHDQQWLQFEGLFDNRTGVSLDRVPDGVSNTLLFGEALGGRSGGHVHWGLSWMGFGVTGTWRGLGGPDSANWADFASHHAGVVHFCFADGSVYGLRRIVDGEAWDSVRFADMPVPLPSSRYNTWYSLQMMAGYQDALHTIPMGPEN